MKKKLLMIMLSAVMVVMMLPSMAFAEVETINWNDGMVAQLAKDGTQVNQYETINAAADAFDSVGEGTYVLTIRNSDVAYEIGDIVVKEYGNKPLTIKSETKDGVTLKYKSDGTHNSNTIFNISGRSQGTGNVTIEGIKFDLSGGAYSAVRTMGGGSGRFDQYFNDEEAGRYARNIVCRDCTFTGDNTTGSQVIQANAGTQPGNILIDGCNCTNVDSFFSGYAYQSLGTTVDDYGIKVKNCTVTNVNRFVNNQAAASDIVVEGCTVTSYNDYSIRTLGSGSGSDVIVRDSVITNTCPSTEAPVGGIVVCRSAGDTVTISNSVLNMPEGFYHVYNVNNKEITIKSGSYRVEELGSSNHIGELSADKTLTASDVGYNFVSVAQIGDIKYSTLADAIAAVPTDGTQTTITMIDDETIEGNNGVTISGDKNVILDLNGHTIKNLVNTNGHSWVILNQGTLTIKDSTDTKCDGSGNGLLTNSVKEGAQAGDWWSTPQYNYITDVIDNDGLVIMESGKIENTASGSICYCVDNNSANTSKPVALQIKGGLLKNIHYTPVRMAPSANGCATLVMTGGMVEGEYGIALNCNSMSAPEYDISISGGSIKADSYALYTSGSNNVNNTEKVKMSISGGRFGDEISQDDIIDISPIESKFIEAGLFTTEPANKYIVDGCAAAAINDSTYKYIVGKGALSSGTNLIAGSFKINPIAYVADGYTVEPSGDTSYPYAVVAKETAEEPTQQKIVVEQKTEVKVDTDKITDEDEVKAAEKAIEDTQVTGVADALTTSGRDAIIQAAINSDKGANEAVTEEVIDKAKQVDVNITVKAEVTAIATAKVENETEKLVEFELDPVAVVTATVVSGDGAVEQIKSEEIPVDNDYLAANNINKIVVTLGCDFEPAQVLHIRDDKVVESFKKGGTASYENGTFAYDNEKNVVTLEITQFSEIQLLAAEKYTNISFDANGGTGTMATVGIQNGSYNLPKCTFTAPAGKQFAGWKIGDNTYEVGDTVTISEDTTIAAQWKDKESDSGTGAGATATKYTITFDANGGTGTMDSVTKGAGKFNLPKNKFTAPEGKQFAGWKIGDKTYEVGDTIEVTADTKVVAIWEDTPAEKATPYLVAKTEAKGKTALAVSWIKCEGAEKYVVYANKCNTRGKKYKVKKIATTAKTSYTIRKINGKKLAKNTFYKVKVVALDANGDVIATAKTMHAATGGYKGKYGNVTAVTANDDTLAVSVGDTKTAGAKALSTIKSLNVPKGHGVQIRFKSSNPKIATVNAAGEVKGVKAGSCTIYIQAPNGVWATTDVTVLQNTNGIPRG